MKNNKKNIKIAVDARPLIHPHNGNASYHHKMLKNLISIRKDTKWLLFSHRPIHELHRDLLKNSNVSIAAERHFLPGPLWLHFILPGLVKKTDCNLFWGSLSMLPFLSAKRFSIPTMVNFHDLNARVVPETMVLWKKIQHRFLDGRSLRDADAVICLSETTKNDILRFYPKLNQRKLHIVYPGSELEAVKPRTPGKLKILKKFILCVGTIEPRKNQKTVIEGYLKAREIQENLPELLFTGRKGWGDSGIHELLSSGNLEERGIYYLDNASRDELAWCYKNALFCILPSLHEGFGLPLLEAMQWKKMTVLSDIPIFREICRTCSFVEARNPDKWKDMILKTALKKKLPAPAFNRKFWSWKERAGYLSGIIDQLTE